MKSWASGGGTTLTNGQRLCTACYQAKEALGWSSNKINRQSLTPLPWPDPGVRVTTPTGHRYVSIARHFPAVLIVREKKCSENRQRCPESYLGSAAPTRVRCPVR
ncbi:MULTISPECIES: hypothetical protein [Arthrobacter]|uniref:hypothetical protein n=1 Tax=Arthrobacter TaxID=1663 RepID=UPI003B589B90